MVENFLTKFRCSTPRFYGNILTLLYLKFETAVHAQIETTHYYLHISWHDMKFKHKLDILFDKRIWSMVLPTWSRDENVFCSID